MTPQRITHRLKRSIALLMVCLLVFMQSAHAGNYIAFIHTDVLGSPVAVTDQNGNIVSREHVTPYGDSLGKRSADDTTPVGSSEHGIGYTGHVKDKDLGLTYMQARYYDPTIGRFMGTDPVGFSATNPELFNRYAYANNNPYKYVDPDGELAIFGMIAVTAIALSIGYIGLSTDVINPNKMMQSALDVGKMLADKMDPDAKNPPIHKGKQNKHKKGTNEHKQSPNKSTWDNNEEADELTQEAWEKGTIVKEDKTVIRKRYEKDRRVGSQINPKTGEETGQSGIQVDMDTKGNIHGSPWGDDRSPNTTQ